MELTRYTVDHLILPDGTELPWMEAPAGRYFLADPGQGRMNVALARVSSDAQGTLNSQVEDACRLARKDGRAIEAIYLDPGYSAFKLSVQERAGLSKLLDDIKAGRVQTVYVYKRDRVARQQEDWFYFLKSCGRYGVEIRFTCSGEPPIGDGLFGDFQENLLINIATLEARITRRRVQDKTLARFRSGEWIGGPMPYGYQKTEEGLMVEHPTQGPVVRKIFSLAVEDLLGCVRIADYLNEHYPGTRYGRRWDSPAVEKVLTNRVYAGYQTIRVRQENGQVAEVLCERFPIITPLVSEDVWERLVAMRKDRKRSRGAFGSRYNDTQHLLFGLLHCGMCGSRMYGKHRSRKYKRQDGEESQYHSYTYCCAQGQQVRGCTYRREVRQEELDEVVLTACRELFSSFDLNRIVDEARAFRRQQMKQTADDLTVARRELGTTTAAILRNQEALENSESASMRHFQKRITELLQRQSSLEARVAVLEGALSKGEDEEITQDQVVRALENWPERFTAASHEERRSLLIDVIRKVTWHPGRREVDIEFTFDPARPLFTLCRQNTPEGVPSVGFCRTKPVSRATEEPNPKVA